MHRRIGAIVMALVLVTVGAAGTAGVAVAEGSVTAGTEQSDAATVAMSDQTTGGTTVVIDEVTVPDGGFVAIHDGTVTEGGEKTFSSVVGSSGYLSAGTHETVEVVLDEPLQEDGTVIAMPHLDSNDNREYDFLSSEGQADGPYTSGGRAVVDDANATVQSMGGETTDGTDSPTGGSGPGFGLALAVVALVGAALLARFR